MTGFGSAAGTEAQAAALLGWLTDPDAPRLCLVTGGPGTGKSALLAWFAAHGTRSGGRSGRRPGGRSGGRSGPRRKRAARTVVPLAGQSALGAAWVIADRLGVVARTPGELIHVLATTETRRATLLLPDLHAAAEPDALAELIAELAALGRIRLVVETRTGTPSHALLTACRATVIDLGAARDFGESDEPGQPRTAVGDSRDLGAAGEAGGTRGAGRTAGASADFPEPGEVAEPRDAQAFAEPPEPPELAESEEPGGAPDARTPRPAGRGGEQESQPRGEGLGLDPSGLATPASGPVTRPQPHPTHVELDPADPVAVCRADPRQVTARYVAEAENDHGGLRAAWLRAGQSLSRDQEPATRALVLRAALGDGADPRLRPALEELAADEPWRVRWSRVRGDLTPPWPGPVTALAAIGDRLLVGGPNGTVRLLDPADATPVGEPLTSPAGRVEALAPVPDGSVLLLDERGRLHTVHGPAPRPPYLERLTAAVTATLTRHPGTALAAISGSVVVGDRLGSVHAFGLTGIHQAALHSGRVTAVTAVETPAPFLCSGGLDGTVRRWIPGQDPHPEPLAERPTPVVALAAAPTPEGPALVIAWADGLVELRLLDTEDRLSFRPGPPVRAVTLSEDGGVVVGMDEALVRLDRALYGRK
ncbi:WD40 repeat domain-containing protein [Streptomyces sp. NPDC015346]|uniref:WD40 repeat domain-containing protein n=1 Tax=Streptomyces sp. NPDC015346 TaxID=3364954 RepID=UPI0036FD9914